MRRPLAALLVLVCGWAAAPSVQACSLGGLGYTRTWVPRDAVVMTGRVVRYVTRREIGGYDHLGTVPWDPNRETYDGGPAVPRYVLAAGIEIERIESISWNAPRRLRIAIQTDVSADCRVAVWETPADVRQHYRIGDIVGLLLHTRNRVSLGDDVRTMEASVYPHINGFLTKQPTAFQAWGTSNSDLRTLHRRIQRGWSVWYVAPRMGLRGRFEVGALRWLRTVKGEEWVSRLVSEWGTSIDFEVAREVAHLATRTSEDQRLRSLMRIWALRAGHQAENERYARCDAVDLVSHVLPDSMAQARFAARLRDVGLPPYHHVGQSPRDLGCWYPGDDQR